MNIIAELSNLLGEKHVLTGADVLAYSTDWTGKYTSNPLAVVRPLDTQQVSEIVKLAAANRISIVPIGGNTGLTGATMADGAILLSLGRLNTIREIRPEARIAIVEAGVILSNLHTAAAEFGLSFPLTFGARGSAMIGGNLATNAGGSNVLRYGNTRALCLGLEVVLPSGEIMDLMRELHKDNAGYDLRDLFIGAEGTLGIITAAVLKLVPKPAAYGTAMVALASLSPALDLLNKLQISTGGAVEAFEFMPASYMELHAKLFPNARAPFEKIHPVNILVEIGATAPRDTVPNEIGEIPIVDLLETALAKMIETGEILDATVAQNETQRIEMWHRREQAADLAFHKKPFVNCDISVPLDKVEVFILEFENRLALIDPTATTLYVSHLGDGNVHPTIWPSSASPELEERIIEILEDVVSDLRGSFSAEHGIGVSKLGSMARKKDATALTTMRAIKSALDPLGIMNPGKILP
ncbi:FAD-binding oxidoreductase [Falsihalocynthiibacter sp. CO-5D18]|uniref:FAD-binding oxidoreductase n=1 Tax=Falsihalocynthiibacter sp. CO-5D18 TaxID=3240872 RepID=UPI00350F0F25